MKKGQRGFTLIEVIVAVAIAAILSVMAFQAMQQAMKNRDDIKRHAARLRAMQYTMRSLVQDLSQLNPRPVRQPVGVDYLPAIAISTDNQFIFTRGGWSNPTGLERSSLQRVGWQTSAVRDGCLQRVRYTFRDNVLYRDYWLVLDATLDPQPISRQLLDGVQNFQVRFLDESHNWQQTWPPASATGGAATLIEQARLPLAVEITLELKDFGVLTRVIEVPG